MRRKQRRIRAATNAVQIAELFRDIKNKLA